MNPIASEINVNVRVMYNPSRRFGNDSAKNVMKSVVFFPPYSSPYRLDIFPRNSFVLFILGFLNI